MMELLLQIITWWVDNNSHETLESCPPQMDLLSSDEPQPLGGVERRKSPSLLFIY